jgi:fructose-bisphosphate aldolase class 1
MELHAWLATHDPALARRVVFVSGGAFTPSAGEYLESVDNLKLDKPFDVAKLLALVAERVKLARTG